MKSSDRSTTEKPEHIMIKSREIDFSTFYHNVFWFSFSMFCHDVLGHDWSLEQINPDNNQVRHKTTCNTTTWEDTMTTMQVYTCTDRHVQRPNDATRQADAPVLPVPLSPWHWVADAPVLPVHLLPWHWVPLPPCVPRHGSSIAATAPGNDKTKQRVDVFEMGTAVSWGFEHIANLRCFSLLKRCPPGESILTTTLAKVVVRKGRFWKCQIW